MEQASEMLKSIKGKFPKKTIIIFEAVLNLRDEGIDLNNLTVSEIAKKAGIGKGTVYDYLNSKEEIIIKALAYEYCLQVCEFDLKVRKEITFKAQVDAACEWVRKNMQRSFFLMRFVKADSNLMKMGKEFCEELFSNDSLQEVFNDTVDYVIDTGVKENLIDYPKNNLEKEMVMNAVGGALFTYLICPEKYQGVQYNQVKQYAHEFVLKLLAKG